MSVNVKVSTKKERDQLLKDLESAIDPNTVDPAAIWYQKAMRITFEPISWDEMTKKLAELGPCPDPLPAKEE